MNLHPATTVVLRFTDLDRWMAHAVQGRSKRHQLWLGRPGKGKTARLHKHIQNTVGHDMFPHLTGRVPAPIYSGRVTPSKWFVRGWQHHLEPLLCLNDISIRQMDHDWESMLCQFLEVAGPRTIRWDLKSKADLQPEDRREITRYLRGRDFLDQFLQEQRERDEDEDEGEVRHRPERSPFRESLTELDEFERAFREEEDEFESIIRTDPEILRLPRSYDTESTVIVIANNLGAKGWERIFSRLRVFYWDPLVEEQIEDLRSWNPPVPGAILGEIEACHRKGEVLNLDLRAVLDAIEALALGMSWEDPLRASFFTATDEQVQTDACVILDWLAARKARVGQTFTDRDLYQEVGCLRGDRNKPRRSVALDYLATQGWIERDKPPTVLRPGTRGRRPGPSFRVLQQPRR